MKTISRKREERTTGELVKEFKEAGGRFDSFWSGLSLSERGKFREYLSQMRPPE